MNKKIIGLVGSLQKKSFNKGLMQAFVDQAPEGIEIEVLDIGTLPFLNEDLEKELPQVVIDFKEKIKNADAVIFATPEYNRSVPGVLKNAVDWISRPAGENSIAGKPTLVVGASPGGTGALMGQYVLKQSLLHLNAQLLGHPEFFVGGAGAKFDEDRNLTDKNTKKYVSETLEMLIAKIG